MKTEKFTLLNQKGQKIVGVINRPDTSGKWPLVILCHGFKGYKEQNQFVYLAEGLVENDFGVLRFDFTNGIGESEGDIFNITVGHYVEDLESVYQYAQNLPNIDKNKIIIYGTSLGGMETLLFTANHPEIQSLILHEPLVKPAVVHTTEVNLKKWKEQGYWIFHSRSKNKDYKVGYQYYEERKNYDMFQVAQKVKLPTLILHAPEAKRLLYKDSQELLKNLTKESQIYPLPGVPHSPETREQMGLIKEKIMNWIKNLN